MIFPLAGFLIGLVFGALRARARKGHTADLVQWALVHGLLFATIGLFVLIAVDRFFY